METIVFMIIIGILSSIFGKAKGSKGVTKNKPFSKYNLDEFRGLFNTNPEKTTIRQPKRTSTENEELQQESMEKKYQQIKQSAEEIRVGVNEPPISEQQQMETLKTLRDKSVVADYDLIERPNEKTLINGIIWSEILGEPRSRKPHFPRKH